MSRTMRSLRMDDDNWAACQVITNKMGVSMSELVNNYLAAVAQGSPMVDHVTAPTIRTPTISNEAWEAIKPLVAKEVAKMAGAVVRQLRNPLARTVVASTPGADAGHQRVSYKTKPAKPFTAPLKTRLAANGVNVSPGRARRMEHCPHDPMNHRIVLNRVYCTCGHEIKGVG